MATVTPGYTWVSGETVTVGKMNSAAAPTVSNIVNADIDANAAIAASKLALTGAITDTQLATGAVTAPKVANGFPVQVVSSFDATKQTVSAASGSLTSVPTTSDGQAYSQLSTSITTSSASNKVLVRVVISAASFGALVAGAVLSVFRASVTNAICATIQTIGGNTIDQVVLEFLDSPATLGSVTYSVRLARTGANGYLINTNTADDSNFLGGVYGSTMTLTEVRA